MNRGVGALERAINTDESIEAFQTLVRLKKEAIAALHNEYLYAEMEYDSIVSFNNVRQVVDTEANRSEKSSCRSDASSMLYSIKSQDGDAAEAKDKGRALLKWQSPEFHKLEMRWRSQLELSVSCITSHLQQDRRGAVSIGEVEAIYESISQLQNAYFQAVENRESNNSLWLRLKMYAASRRGTLSKILSPFGLLRNVVNEAETLEVLREHPDSQLIQQKLSRDYPSANGFTFNKDLTIGVLDARKLSMEKMDSFDNTMTLPGAQDTEHPYGNPTIAEFLEQMDSTTKFYAMTRNIYIQYGDGSMSYKVFNNIIEFLLRSLGIPSIDKTAVRRLLKSYNVAQGSTINFSTFVILYWEIAYIIRGALEVLHPLGAHATHSHNLMLQQREEDTYTDIECIIQFKKKLNSGDSCTKFLAVHLDTGKLVVVDVITKSPKTPKFEQIFMEVSRISKLQNQHLAIYLGAYHDLNCIYVISEYCEYGSLLSHMQIKRETIYTMGFIHLVFTQLIEAMLYIHCNNMVHGSISIDKIMLSDSEYNHIKIRDLGMKGLLDTDVQGSALTYMHMAHEGMEGRLCHKSDIWSAGVILAFLLTGVMPEERMNYTEYIRVVEKALVSAKIFPKDDELRDIIRKMLSPDPASRPTAFDIITHPWYTKSMRMEETPGNFRLLIQPLNTLTKYKRLQTDVVRVLESQGAIYVSKVRKIQQTIQLLRKLQDDRLLVKDLKRMLQLEGLSNQIINNILVVAAFNESEVRGDDVINALSQWKSGELAFVWNSFKNRVENTTFSMRRMEFARFLAETETRLLSQEEVARLCNTIAVNGEVYWVDFVRYFD